MIALKNWEIVQLSSFTTLPWKDIQMAQIAQEITVSLAIEYSLPSRLVTLASEKSMFIYIVTVARICKVQFTGASQMLRCICT